MAHARARLDLHRVHLNVCPISITFKKVLSETDPAFVSGVRFLPGLGNMPCEAGQDVQFNSRDLQYSHLTRIPKRERTTTHNLRGEG